MVMVRVFQTLAQHGDALSAEIVTAKNYKPASERGDENWVVRFANDGGQIVLSGDVHLRSRVHERAALAQVGLIAYCFEPKWGQLGFFSKSAMVLHWWPKIRSHMGTANQGTCWEIPFTWNHTDLKDVSALPSQIASTKQPKLKTILGGKLD